MAAIYTRQNTKFISGFASDNAIMSAKDVKLGIVQNLQIQFAQQIARIYDITNGGGVGQAAVNQAAVFYVGGRTNGQLTIARVVGPSVTGLSDFYTRASNVCVPIDLSFSFGAGCQSGSSLNVTYAVTGAVMTNIGLTVGAQDMIINENVTLMFANLTVTDAAAGGGLMAGILQAGLQAGAAAIGLPPGVAQAIGGALGI